MISIIANVKSLRGKTLMKNFSNTNRVLVTTIPALDVPPGMIDYTFLSHGKNRAVAKTVVIPR